MPFQVGTLIESVEQLKELGISERERTLSDPWEFKGFLVARRFNSQLLVNRQDRGKIAREILLHIVFPDYFERIGSTDKGRIANAGGFARFVVEPADDVDRKIQQIRQGLERERGRGFDFYAHDVRSRWDSRSDTWNDLVRRAKEVVESGAMEREEIGYKREMGNDIAASRRAVLADADNWHELLKHALRTRGGHPISWQLLADFHKLCDEHPDEAKSALRELWGENDLSVADRIRAFTRVFPVSALRGAVGNSTNVISVLLMGLDVEAYPPFQTNKFNSFYALARYGRPEPDADEGTVYEHALGFLDRFIEEAALRDLELRHRLEMQSVLWQIQLPVENGGREGSGEGGPEVISLQLLADELCLSVEFLEEIQTLLEDKRQVIFQGPPGTGKTYVAQKLAAHLAGGEECQLVQFHPSYSYEDFVQGYRPTLINGQPGFELRDGPLLRVARLAAENPQEKYFLVIDEINRGNLAKVFGELYFLLEYRGFRMNLMHQEGQEAEDGFLFPSNLYIIGTMNTADRSIALVDLALRRRFTFVEFHPDEPPVKGLLRRWLWAQGLGDMEWVADMVDRANEKLNDRHAAIGPSYFMKQGLDEARVKRIWKHEVLPYVAERFFGDQNRLEEFQLSKLMPERFPGSNDGPATQNDGNQ